jgi:hypothetical protein
MASLTKPRKQSKQEKRSALAEVAALQEAVNKETRALRQLERAREEAGHAVVARREEYIAALARGEDGTKEHAALRAADDEARNSWEPKIEAAGRRVRAAQRAVQEYASSQLDAIGREKRVRDEAAANHINELLGERDRAIAALRAEAHEATS